MVDITYCPQPGDSTETEWRRFAFTAGKAVSFDGRKSGHKEFIEAAKENPFFEVEGEAPKKPPKSDKPETAEQYRAYAIDWITKSTSADELDRRWRQEEPLRDEVGWGTDDQTLIEPILDPKRENLKRAENQG